MLKKTFIILLISFTVASCGKKLPLKKPNNYQAPNFADISDEINQ